MPRILIADDNDENLYYLQALFTAGGYEVATAKNGAEALDAALARPPALLVTDILMPVMDGFALCRQWRSHPRLAAIPFVFYTATYTDPKDKELGLRLGADEFLVKPVEPDVLLEIVGAVLRRKQAGTLPDRSPAASESEALLKQYKAALIRKLEDKLVQLEAANRKLADAEELVRAVLDNSPLAIIAADVEGRILLTNPAFTSTFGYSAAEATGRLCSDLIDLPGVDSEMELLAKRTASQKSDVQYSKRRRKDGALIDLEICLGPMTLHGELSGWFAIYRDITEQRKLQDQLRQSQKLEAVGQLAAGVAHDFNNLLSIMVGYSELIRGNAEPQSRLQHQADQIRQACARASVLTRQLLAFSRRQVLLPQVIELESFVEETLKMVRRLIREDIELVVNLRKPVGHVLADPAQFEQVLLNLVTNARDAMPQGGRLTLDLCNLDVGESEARRPPLRPGEYVRLSVTDTGDGMDEATMARIFEPFFTTKPTGYGTGLGLASVHGIVEQSGGVILVSSQPGKGACFEVYFPRITADAACASQPPEAALPQGSETILVAEDEETLRQLICEMLGGLGYRVLAAGSAGDAARMIRDLQEHLDLLITDVIMPEMSGRDLSELAWSLRPQLRVLYVSGYDPTQIRTRPGPAHRAEFLAKPFTREKLAAAVRRLLNGKDLSDHSRGYPASQNG